VELQAIKSAEDVETAIVGDVGSKSVRLALTDVTGALDLRSVKSYDVTGQATFSGILVQFSRESGLPALPQKLALAIAGAPRGDALTLPNSRMLVSRSGLQSMLKAPPVILNECAASAWALTSAKSQEIEPIAGRGIAIGSGGGTYCVLSLGTGLGVSVLQREDNGRTVVLATEAGHAGLAPENPQDAEIVEIARRTNARISAETLISAPGLVRIYAAIATQQGTTGVGVSRPEQVTEMAHSRDPVAVKAVAAFSRMLWAYAGNLALTYGAWDGIVMTGTLSRVLRSSIRASDAYTNFYVRNPYQRRLNEVPLGIASIEHAELKGAVQALKSYWS
jgi:glucokinase